MKVLFVGNTHGTSSALHYFTSLVRLGTEVLPFDPGYPRPTRRVEKVLEALRKNPSSDKENTDRFCEILLNNRFDLVLNLSENFLHHGAIEQVQKKSPHPPLFVYHSHDNIFSPGIQKPPYFTDTIKSYDFVFTTKSQNVRLYESMGVQKANFLPSAFEPSIHRPVLNEDSQYGNKFFDITFVGTYDRSRDTVFDHLKWTGLEVWGNRWQTSPYFRKYPGRVHPKAIYYFEMADVISHTKCSLGLLREEAGDRHTQRTFEIPACGSLQLAPRNDEILGFFVEDKEIICYATLEELREKLSYYLQYENKRAKIARAGFDRCIRDNHTYLNRVSSILEVVAATKAKRKSFAIKK